MKHPLPVQTLWWQRDDVQYVEDELHFSAHNLNTMAHELGTPLYVYSSDRPPLARSRRPAPTPAPASAGEGDLELDLHGQYLLSLKFLPTSNNGVDGSFNPFG